MRNLRIGKVQTSGDGSSLSVEFETRESRQTVSFKSNGAPLRDNTEAFIALALLPAMKRRADILARGTISPIFLWGIETIQEVFHEWKPSYTPTAVRGIQTAWEERPPDGRVGVFFSGGLDSFYTFLKRKDEITDLIFIHGFDLNLNDHAGRAQALEMVKRAGDHFGVRVLEIETDVRAFLESYVFWGLSHGAALAGIGHLLSPEFKRIYIPGAGIYASLIPWGVHPLLDSFWSSEALDFVSDGYEAARVKKAALLAVHEIALQNLRVCLRNPGSAVNCGECEKCVRTMVDLRINRALERCTTFRTQLDLDRVAKYYAKAGYQRVYLKKSLEYLEAHGDDPELTRTLRKVFTRPALPKSWVKSLRKISKRFRLG